MCVWGGQKLISQYGVFQFRSAVYMSGREKPASTSVIPHYAVKSAFLDYGLRTSLAKEVKGQMSIVTQLRYVMLCYYYFMREVTPSAEAGINGEP